MRKFWVYVPDIDENKAVFVRANRFTFEDGRLVFISEAVKTAAFDKWNHVVEETSE